MKLKCLIPVPGCSRWVVRLIYRWRSVNSERCWEVIALSNLPLQYVDMNVPTAVSWTNWTSSQPAVTNNLTWHHGGQTLRSAIRDNWRVIVTLIGIPECPPIGHVGGVSIFSIWASGFAMSWIKRARTLAWPTFGRFGLVCIASTQEQPISLHLAQAMVPTSYENLVHWNDKVRIKYRPECIRRPKTDAIMTTSAFTTWPGVENTTFGTCHGFRRAVRVYE